SSWFCFHCSGDPRDLHSFPTRRSSDLVGVGDGGVGGHGNRAPDAAAAFLHLRGELGGGGGIALVLGGDVLVGGADELLVDGVAGGAVVLLRERLVGVRGKGGGEACEGGAEGERFLQGVLSFPSRRRAACCRC